MKRIKFHMYIYVCLFSSLIIQTRNLLLTYSSDFYCLASNTFISIIYTFMAGNYIFPFLRYYI